MKGLGDSGMAAGTREQGSNRQRGATLRIVLVPQALAVVKPTIVLGILIVVWQAAVDLGWIPSTTLAAPSSVADYVWSNGAMLLEHAGTTLTEVVIAFAIALTAGVVIAILVSEFRVLEESVLPLLVVSQVIPSIAIAPLLVLLLGFGLAPKVATAAIIAFFPVLVNTVAGLRTLPRETRELGAVLKASRWQMLRMFSLPNALPYIFAGARVSITLSVIGAVVGEFVTAQSGLGFLVLQGSSTLNPPMLFAALFFLAVLGIGLFTIVRIVEWAVLPWARHETGRS